MDLAGKKVLVTGGNGFLGRAVCARLKAHGANVIIPPTSSIVDLRRRQECRELLYRYCPAVVIHLAARCGGIAANQARPAEFLYDNAVMGLHMLDAARRANVRKYVLVGTCCSYPKHCRPPFREIDLWAGYPEETNAPYGLAKRLLVAQAQAYRQQYGLNAISLIPANLYGPGDCFDPARSHVVPALIRKMIEAKAAGARACTAWGTGQVTRDFLYVDDAAAGIVRAAERYDAPQPLNLGTGVPTRIATLAFLIRHAVGFTGEILWHFLKPEGQPNRWLDTTRAQDLLDWRATTSLEVGLAQTIDWYLREFDAAPRPA